MASTAKRLKLSRRKNISQQDITTQTKTSTARGETSAPSNSVLESDSYVSPSLQNLRKKLRQSVPELLNWRELSPLPHLGAPITYPSATNHPEKSVILGKDDTTLSSIKNNDTKIHQPSSSAAAQVAPSSSKQKNPFIEECPLCQIFFPHDWTQEQIQTHVATHLDFDPDNFDD